MNIIEDKLDTIRGLLHIKFAWLYRLHMGKLVISGPYEDKEAAFNQVSMHPDSDWEVIELSTRDTAKATQMIKQQVYNVTGDLSMSLKRASHKPDEIPPIK
jgi:hypothetical protein